MRTSGDGNDGLFILTALCLLTVAGILIMGGPHEFFQAANKTLLDAAESVVLWVQAHR